MIKNEELLPLGSIVYLEEGTVKLMIVGRGVIYDDPEGTGQLFADYMGILYPAGLQQNQLYFSNMRTLTK
ncbi:DUF4176 domain-containing protein [Streptococcus agalactiae]|uniref:DUF4176 domain-containing protein n=1 Tax=Streptococcus agalactiae TaxID=1311 RepID=UPI0002ECA159|nr:hypothetical protein TH70_0135 [Streptococcus agalactiae]